MSTMNDSTQPSSSDGELQTTLTTTETSSTHSASTNTSRRSSLMHLITEPVAHLRNRKRKWPSSKHSGSVEEPTSTSTEPSSDNDNASSSDTPTMSTSPWGSLQRKRSAATERVVGKIKTIFRKDSHESDNAVLLEKACRVHRDMHLENNIPGASIIIGPNCCAHVHAFFDVMGEAGSSDYYETLEWKRFHRRQAFLRKEAARNASIAAEAMFLAQTPQRDAISRQSQPLQIAVMTSPQLMQQSTNNGIQIAMSQPEGAEDVPGEAMHGSSIYEDTSQWLPGENVQRLDQLHVSYPVVPGSYILPYAPATIEFDSDADSFSSEGWESPELAASVGPDDECLDRTDCA